MKSGTISQRDIVLIPFPYSDLSTNKKRPVLIISNRNYHKNNADVICCAITSRKDVTGIKINNSDLDEGSLKTDSTIKPGKIYSILANIAIKKIGKLKIERVKEVIEELNKEISLDN